MIHLFMVTSIVVAIILLFVILWLVVVLLKNERTVNRSLYADIVERVKHINNTPTSNPDRTTNYHTLELLWRRLVSKNKLLVPISKEDLHKTALEIEQILGKAITIK